MGGRSWSGGLVLDVPKVVMVLDKDIDKVTILGHVDHFGLISFKNRHLFANRGSVILLMEKILHR